MSIEFLRAKTQATKARLDKLKPEQLRKLETISLEDHVTEMSELLEEIDRITIANKSICEIDMIKQEVRFTVWPAVKGMLLRVDKDLSQDSYYPTFQEAILAAAEYSCGRNDDE